MFDLEKKEELLDVIINLYEKGYNDLYKLSRKCGELLDMFVSVGYIKDVLEDMGEG